MDPFIETDRDGDLVILNKSQSHQYIHHFFTFNNYTAEDVRVLEMRFKDICSKYCFQEEVGSETETIHLQGVISCKKRMRWSEFGLSKRIHWEVCKDVKKAYKYCCKEATRIPGTAPYCYNFTPPIELDIIKRDKLYDWQVEIINIISNKPDHRTIHWYWETNGNVGKTTFAKYLSYHHKAIPLEGKKNDILYCAAQFESNIYIYDIERSLEEYVSYGAIEKIKNGYFMSAKYESEPIIRNCPHVIIFANFEPDYNKLSADRWNVVRI